VAEEGDGAHEQVHVGEAAVGRSGGRRGEQLVGAWPPPAAGQGGCRRW
jgi:hypothetical protein